MKTRKEFENVLDIWWSNNDSLLGGLSSNMVLHLKDFISQTRQADVEWVIEYIESKRRTPSALVFNGYEHRDNHFYNLALDNIMTHLKQLKQNI